MKNKQINFALLFSHAITPYTICPSFVRGDVFKQRYFPLQTNFLGSKFALKILAIQK